MQGVRLLVMGVLWIGSFFLVLDRVNISLAAPRIMDELQFDGTQMGFVLSIYYWGYLLGHVSSGLVSDQLRLRSLNSWMILLWSVLTALTGACSAMWQFVLVRLLFGISEGATVNMTHKLQNNWLLPAERGKAYGIFIGFAYLGIAFGMPFVGWLIALWDWRWMFVAVGALTLIQVVLFSVFVRDHPHEHPWLSSEEKIRFREGLAQGQVASELHGQEATTMPLRERLAALARMRVFWFLCIAGFFNTFVYFTAMSWLPGYLVKERGFTILNSGVYLTIPYLAAFAGMLVGGSIGDRFGNRSLVSLFAGLLTFPALLGLAQNAGVEVTILLMSVALFLNSAAVNGFAVLVFDLIPGHLFGAAIGIAGGFCGGLGGVLGPLLLGYLFDQTGSFFWGFVALGVSAALGALMQIPIRGHEKRSRAAKLAREASTVSPLTVQEASS